VYEVESKYFHTLPPLYWPSLVVDPLYKSHFLSLFSSTMARATQRL
jgi:hypothetical protein